MGKSMDMADAAYKFLSLPKIPVYLPFVGRRRRIRSILKILFDRSIEKHLSADAIWGAVNLVSDALLMEN